MEQPLQKFNEVCRASAVRVKGDLVVGVHPVARGELSELRLQFQDAEIIDYGDLVVSPGLIDVHTHLNEPGRVEWEGLHDVFAVTRFAAARLPTCGE